MFSPKRLWPLTPMSETFRKKGPASLPDSELGSAPLLSSDGGGGAKGKAVSLLDGDNGAMEQGSLSEKLTSLEQELFEYQYNMGLLLIEKKEWTARYEEIRHALSDAKEALRREQAAHATAISEVEKREESLKKALGVERQCVHDLEKALRDMRAEYAEVKFNADCKLAEANAMITSIEGKSLEIEAKFHAADSKLAEINRKSSEVETRWNELVMQENTLRRERSSFDNERKAHDSSLSKQREDLREWDRKLQEAEERLADSRRMLNQREDRANENDKVLTEKQNDLEERKKKLEAASSSLREKEDDINRRIADLALQEEESGNMAKRLGEKEKQLSEWEDKLNSREKIEIQKLLDQHKLSLDEKQKAFELDMENKRKLHEEELRNKSVEVERKESEIAHMEDKIRKREQAVEKKMEKVIQNEEEYASKLKALKERENSHGVEVEKLEKEKKQILDEKEELLRFIADLEKLKTETEDLQLKLREEREQLKITEEERKEHFRLQSELKLETERYRVQNEKLFAEADSLKLEKEKFEKEWEELDDKRSEISKEKDELLEQKRSFEKYRQSEEERLQNQKQETQLNVQRELESLKLARESFAANMENEKSLLSERLESEKSGLVHDFEIKKQELEAEIQRRQEDMENSLLERERAFGEQRERELSNISYLKEVAQREMEELKLEKVKREKEKMDISQDKDHLEARQLEIRKDIEELVALSQKLKDQREQLLKEKERFSASIDKRKSCNSCGEIIREFMLSDHRPLAELENIEPPSLPKLAEDYLKETVENKKLISNSSPADVKSRSPATGGTISWIRKCTSRIFKLSPGTKLELENAEDSVEYANKAADSPKALPGSGVAEPSGKRINDSFDAKIGESNSAGVGRVLPIDEGLTEASQSSDRRARHRESTRTRSVASRETSLMAEISSGGQPNGNREHSVHENDQSLAETDLNQRKRNRSGSQAATNEIQVDDQSDGAVDGDRPKRRQKVSEVESFGQKRYNLRQPKKSVVTSTNGALPLDKKGKGKGRGKRSKAPGLTTNESGKFEVGATVSQSRSGAAASEFSADSPFLNAGSTQIDNVGTANNLAGEGAPHDKQDGTNQLRTESVSHNYHDSSSDGDDDDEVTHPGELSLGKKLLNFLVM